MKTSKPIIHSIAEQRLELWDNLFQALAHATRRHILLVLWFRGGSMSAGEIVSRFHCSWPTISRHLRLLVDAGLVTCTRQGKARDYTINESQLTVVREWLDWFRPECRNEPGTEDNRV